MEALGMRDEMGDKSAIAAQNSLQLIAFSIGEQTYGVEITTVREIRAWNGATPLPNTREFVRGVINLRGTIVPVIDLRLKLRLAQARYDAFTVMIVLNVQDRVVGIVVDSVSDVMALGAEQIRATPEFGASVDTRFISGIGTVDDRMLILLDIEALIDSADLGAPDARPALAA